MSTGTILYLVEGKQERSINEQIRSLTSIGDEEILPSGTTVVYGTCIYGLFKKVEEYISTGEEFDLFHLLQEIKERTENQKLEEINKNDISEIYLIFDYDPHVSNFDEKKIQKMCEIFNDEYSFGKLFINYPMIEVFRHCYKLVKSGCSFLDERSPLSKSELTEYKKFVSQFEPTVKHIDCCDTLRRVFKETIFKSNNLVNSQYNYPTTKDLISQKNILEIQISLLEEFHLLSGIPLLIHHYHRDDFLKKYLSI
jgi:hypothetical protein